MAHPTAASPRRAPAAPRSRAERSGRRPRRSERPRAGIRWDRVGRVALLIVLGVILLLYIAPLRAWLSQSRAAERERAALHELERENATLERRAAQLSSPDAVEREARRIGMVRRNERAVVVEDLPAP